MLLNTLTSNLRGARFREATLNGRDFYVCPVVMLTEGVHRGSNGPLFYPKEELRKYPEFVWNHKPIVVYHPEINGRGVSACSPEILERQSVGMILNAQFNGKLRAEAWLEKSRVEAVDKRVKDFIHALKVMEVSTGVLTENENTPGNWNGKDYVGIARNYRGDHLALLPDKIGACSVSDGAGLLQLNQLSDSLQQQLAEKGKLVLSLQLGDDDDEPSVTINDDKEEIPMGVKEKVDSVIANKENKWAEDDRKILLTMNESQLDKLLATGAPKEEEKPKPVEKLAVPEPTPKPAPVVPVSGTPIETPAPAAPALNQKPATDLEYLAAMPANMRSVFEYGLQSLSQEKDQHVAAITANAANKFDKDTLNKMDLPTLRNLALLAGAPTAANQQAVPNFFGQGMPPTVNQANQRVQAPLLPPKLTFNREEDKKKAS